MQHKTIKINRDKVQGTESFWSTKMADVILEWLKTKNTNESKYKSAFKSTAQSICQRAIWHLFHIPSETEKEKEQFISKI